MPHLSVGARAFRHFAWAVVFGALITLAGCGGGGDAAPAPPAPAELAAGALSSGQAPSLDSSADAASPAVSVADPCGIARFQEEVLRLINEFRSAPRSCGSAGTFEAAPPLEWNDLLAQAGGAHAQDMAAQNYFEHVSLDGRKLADRVSATGYLWFALGENIAAGFTTVPQVMAGWQASPGHCENLMNPAFTQVGVACVPGSASSTYSHYWAMELGLPR
jgi:uncharacterized protein YkwD